MGAFDIWNNRLALVESVNYKKRLLGGGLLSTFKHSAVLATTPVYCERRMFIIDNSTSMMGSGSVNPRDSAGVRFKVVSALLDTIYKQIPDADIGLTVFRDYLYFDARDNSNFAAFPDEYYTQYPLAARNEEFKNQAYIPLLRLDSTLQDGVKAIDLLKKMLLTQKVYAIHTGVCSCERYKY